MSLLNSSWIDDELRLLHASALRFAKTHCAPHREAWERQGMCSREAWERAAEAGLLLASVPEAYGGAGGSFAHEAVIIDALYRGDAMPSIGLGNSVHSHVVAHYILRYGTEDQKAGWLPRMARGELIGAVAMTEPGTGSDLQGVRTSATADGECYRIDGAKTFITNGQHANLILVVARTRPDGGARGISLIGVETDGVEGFSRGRNLEKIGLKEADTSELFFSDVAVPRTALLGGEEGRGFYQLMEQLPQERLSLALAAATATELAVELTVAYTRERQAFGKPLIEFQNTRFKLAECSTEAAVCRAFVDQCLLEHLEGRLTAERASMAKWWSSQKQCEVVDECLQLFGGYGYMWEYPIARLYADSRVQKIYGGTNEIMKELIARGL